jgi:hypothetical protein
MELRSLLAHMLLLTGGAWLPVNALASPHWIKLHQEPLLSLATLLILLAAQFAITLVLCAAVLREIPRAMQD